jgi:glycosyltransferase involved in cell wall biosynthesis
VSIVIPTHNRRERLGLTLACALGQTGVDHEVIVVDDGSTDGTARYVGDRGDARLRLVRHETARRMSGARNAGAAVAQGRFLAFLDDDDLWAPDKLLAQVAAVAAVPGARWSAVGSVTVDEQFRITGFKRPPPSGSAHGALAVRNVVPGGGSGVLVDAGLFAEVGGFDPRFAMVSDRDLWIRLAHSSPVASIDRPLVGYVRHGSNLSIEGAGHTAELDALEEKYRGLDERVFVLVDRATVAARSGRRAEAVRLFLSAAATHRDVRWLLRAASIGAGPGVETAARRIYGTTLPRGWRADAERWLAGVSAAR